MIVRKNPISFITMNGKPNENWTNETDVFIVDDNSELAQKIKRNYPFFELVVENGEVIDVELTEKSIEPAKEEKIKELSSQCQQTIINGFIASNGNGYRLTTEDQLNMQGQKDELKDDETITEVDWMTINDENVTHSREEWLTVYKEAFRHKKECIFKNKQLRDQVKAATTKEEVEAITW
ncbi:protein of unknown function [Alteribacillus persepolensis]|uniref:DUF4376 domain-containing protein n=1 Tax=Alteribacillus persepolensis TaxID=568899 RepID=A0A1G8IBM6_9BACI|nr:DUF4376 domain-containing protein [Alteribacillus persepolensis]SDI16379.1 protein of unknown function [Alteribacillus persepolensis]